jgi:hypothetical protein
VTPEETVEADRVAAEAARKTAEAGRTYSESEFKEVIAARDEAKRKLREREDIEAKAREAKLLEEGKLKELLQAKEKELEGLDSLKEKLRKLEEKEAKLLEAEAKRKEMLLQKLPEEKRKLYSEATLSILEDIVQSLQTTDPTKASKAGNSEPSKTYESYTQEELVDMQRSNPDGYRALYREYYKKKNGRYPS